MSRPRLPSSAIVVSANGAGVAWEPTVGFVGDAVLVARAVQAANGRVPVDVHPAVPALVAGADDAVGAYAALMWAAGGRGVLASAPDGLLDAVFKTTNPGGTVDTVDGEE